MSKREQLKGRDYRGCYLEPNHVSHFTGTYWRWAAWVDGAGGLYADTLAGIKELIRVELAKQGLRRQA